MGEIDWRALRGSAVLLVSALVLGAAAAGAASRFHDASVRDHERQKARLASIRSQYGAIDEQRRRIERWLPSFHTMQAEGIIGDEQRLAWIETLRGAAAHLALPSLRYRIERRTAYEGTGLDLRSGAFRPFSTVVRLDLGLLHEGRSGTAPPRARRPWRRTPSGRTLRRQSYGAELRDASRRGQPLRAVRAPLDHARSGGDAAVSRAMRAGGGRLGGVAPGSGTTGRSHSAWSDHRHSRGPGGGRGGRGRRPAAPVRADRCGRRRRSGPPAPGGFGCAGSHRPALLDARAADGA